MTEELKQAAQAALDQLEFLNACYPHKTATDASDALRRALTQRPAAQATPEPRVRLTADITDPAVQARLAEKFGDVQATPEPVAEDWRADFDLAAQMLTWGRDDGGLDAAQIKEIDAHAAKMFARLKAHATPEPVGEPAAWRWFNSNGDQVSNWLDFKAAQKANVEAQVAEAGGRIEYAYTRPAPGVPEGFALVPVEPTLEMLKAMESQWLVGSQVDMANREYAAMLAAAQAKGADK